MKKITKSDSIHHISNRILAHVFCVKLLLLFFAILLFSVQAVAQSHKEKFSPQDFTRDLESFIVREACLSPNEAAVFFPLFHEMHDKQRGINWQINELKKRVLPENSTDKDYHNLINDICKLKIEQAELEESYYKKMCKVVPSQKVLNAMLAEDRFHRRMLKNFNNPPQKK